MQDSFQHLMQEATRLTRSGNLQAATAAIQSALRDCPATPVPSGQQVLPAEGIVFDVPSRVVPELGDFIAGQSHGRAYKLYVPPDAGNDRPLVVMLHGCTQDPDDFAAGTRMNQAALEHGCFVLYPAQSRKANPQGCWNWFKHSHQERGRGEPALIAGMTREIMARYGIDSARVYVAGLSAGGAMAAILAGTHPDLFAAAGVHSGLRAGAASDLPSALAAMRSGAASPKGDTGAPTIVFHGDTDATVHPDNGAQVIRASAGAARPEPQQGGNHTRLVYRADDGHVVAEHWVIHGSGHAWSGGSSDGSYTDPRGPNASREMLRFFLEHPKA